MKHPNLLSCSAKYLIPTLLLLLFTSHTYAQIGIQNQSSFGGSRYDTAESFVETEDGNFIILSLSLSSDIDFPNDHERSSTWVMKVDPQGNEIWKKNFSTDDICLASFIKKAISGGYIIGMTARGSNPLKQGQGQGWIIKIDENGNILWEKSVGGTEWTDGADDAVILADGSIVIVGDYDGDNLDDDVLNFGGVNPVITKLNSDGNKLWEKIHFLDSFNTIRPQSIIHTPSDDGFLITGSWSTYDRISNTQVFLTAKGWFLKLDSQGNILWETIIGDDHEMSFNDLLLLDDGSYLGAGWIDLSETDEETGDGQGHYEMLVVNISAQGNVLWQQQFGDKNEKKEVAINIFQLEPNSFYLNSITNAAFDLENPEEGAGDISSALGARDIWISNHDLSGNMLWNKTLGGTGSDQLNDIIPTNDGFIAVGESRSSDINIEHTNYGNYDALFIECIFTNDADNDGFYAENDCDDNNPNINPHQTEITYNGLDDDCNSSTLDDDFDQDGFLLADDCDDNNAAINPNASDIPDNGIDENCDGVDATSIVDADGDGFDNTIDCNDNDASINPNQTESPYNGIDDDCNPATLDDDLDQDGFAFANDCDDNNASVNPNQTEQVYNGLDDDCNPATLDDDLDQDGFASANDCDDNNASINPDQAEIPYNGIDEDCNAATLDDDLDQDGFASANDCDDNNSSINPDQAEIPYNGLDEDCNATTLDDDLDQDGFVLADDCDDNNSDINPNQTEVAYNGIDEDCNAATPDDDLDQDGFLLADDCDDNNADINSSAEDIPNNGIDEDCDGVDATTSIHEISNLTISIYPIPAAHVINIDVSGPLNFQANLYNVKGKLIKTQTSINQINVEAIPNGTYILEIKDLKTGAKIVERIVVAK